jgi:hypothetical protein
MTYLVGASLADQPAGVRFRELLNNTGILQMPGTHNGMAALQARDSGFSAGAGGQPRFCETKVGFSLVDCHALLPVSQLVVVLREGFPKLRGKPVRR